MPDKKSKGKSKKLFEPTEIIILGKRYQVVFCDHPADVSPGGDELLHGHMSSDRREIRVYRAEQDEDTIDTLCHEIAHAIMDEAPALRGLLKSDPDIEEIFVSEWAALWVDTWRRNGLSDIIK